MGICKKCGKPKRNSPVVARAAAVMRHTVQATAVYEPKRSVQAEIQKLLALEKQRRATAHEPPKPYDLALEEQSRLRDAAAGIDHSAPNRRATEAPNVAAELLDFLAGPRVPQRKEPPKSYDLAIERMREARAV